MGLSLQEQLLKAGLVNQKQVKKAEHDKRVQKKKGKKGAQTTSDDTKERLKKQRVQQAEHDRQLNRQRLEQEQQKENHAAAQQLIQKNRTKIEPGDVPFHYVTGGGQIERLYVTQEIADQLGTGVLGVAVNSGENVLVSADTVAKVLQRDESLIIAYNDPADFDEEYPSEW
ncbi:MAG: hypothetical protein BA874_06415 [Desulfuromonadales bacterium C00003068]|nr:MAG: hypothetical protein BA874_06415 [Desulfuromonadales bacterium C00003068]